MMRWQPNSMSACMTNNVSMRCPIPSYTHTFNTLLMVNIYPVISHMGIGQISYFLWVDMGSNTPPHMGITPHVLRIVQ